MSAMMRGCGMAALVGIGFFLGRLDFSATTPVARAQDEPPKLSEEATKKIVLANDALKAASEALKNETLYHSATKTLNIMGVLTGGFNALDDLEAGRGVDPETFAALYADQAIDEVKEHLGRDEDGRLTYKNKVIRIYPISRLRNMYQRRQIVTGEIKAPKADQN